ncbi:unnamed protein product [Rhizophagus irregularis]|nr:unnamed protein product [Rhizophagus irregularis]CAB4446160.1 unnamed protein product [Rhizophagus irregularis]
MDVIFVGKITMNTLLDGTTILFFKRLYNLHKLPIYIESLWNFLFKEKMNHGHVAKKDQLYNSDYRSLP